MAYSLTLVFDGLTQDEYWNVNTHLGISRGSKEGYPPGLIVHAGGTSGSGIIVTEIWDSKASHEAFMASRLGAALQAVNVTPPAQVIEADTVNFQQLA